MVGLFNNLIFLLLELIIDFFFSLENISYMIMNNVKEVVFFIQSFKTHKGIS